jgi:hypothetical protein
MSKTLSELDGENAYKLGDVYKCIYSIDNNSDYPIYIEGDIYPVIIGASGNLGINDNMGEFSMCRTGSSKFELVEAKVATIQKEVEVYITKYAAINGKGCGEYFFEEEGGYEQCLIKAKITFEVPNRKIEITEQDLRRALKIADTKLAKGDGNYDENVYQELFKESK